MESAGLKCDEVSSAEDLKRQFPGVDYGLLRENPDAFNAQRTGEGIESKIDLLGRTDDFLRWIKNRPERVIAGELLLVPFPISPKHTCFCCAITFYRRSRIR